MSRREHYIRKTCAHEGCREFGTYRFSSVRELRESSYFGNKPWLCARHSHPEEILSAENKSTTQTMISRRGAGNELYWYKNGDQASLGWGFFSGPGFRAWAKDFPEGTQLTITATVTNKDPK